MDVTYQEVSEWLGTILTLQDRIRSKTSRESYLLILLSAVTDRIDDIRRDYPEHEDHYEGNDK